jgi:hypothetical protein
VHVREDHTVPRIDRNFRSLQATVNLSCPQTPMVKNKINTHYHQKGFILRFREINWMLYRYCCFSYNLFYDGFREKVEAARVASAHAATRHWLRVCKGARIFHAARCRSLSHRPQPAAITYITTVTKIFGRKLETAAPEYMMNEASRLGLVLKIVRFARTTF